MYWTIHLDGGPRKVNHAAACVGDKIFSFGGYCSVEAFDDWDDIPVHVLDTNTLRWKEVSYFSTYKSPCQRYGHTVIEYKNKVYMWGGRNNTKSFNKLYCFDIETLTWTRPPISGDVPIPKDGHSACRIDNKMYIFGGFEDRSDQYTSDVDCLNLDTFQWTRLQVKGLIPVNRDFHSAVPIGTRIYIFGGRREGDDFLDVKEEYLSEIFYLDTMNCEWIKSSPTKGDPPIGRRSHSAWTYRGDMYIFGGYNGNLKAHFNDLYKFSPSKNEWQMLQAHGEIPSIRRRQVCLMIKSKMYLFGGTSPKFEVSAIQNSDDLALEDNHDLHVLDFEPTLRTLCILSVITNNLDQSLLPREILYDIRIRTCPNKITGPFTKLNLYL